MMGIKNITALFINLFVLQCIFSKKTFLYTFQIKNLKQKQFFHVTGFSPLSVKRPPMDRPFHRGFPFIEHGQTTMMTSAETPAADIPASHRSRLP
ncbi:hypothetical protein OGM23_14020 [Dickeya fangzhongdai]|uniref:hypothetical protein n=1 Tax=Dickeya fangzhongdai TaxID=1778540 RepID=UPI002B2B4757|nr:hypothetical protein OGM23_14020 [Dickeya fangzhongdai]